jgi:hypothetical protein
MTDRQQATRGFVTLFVDSIRTMLKSFTQANVTHINYTVHSQKPRYQLDYWPQFNFSPLAFGGGAFTTCF